MADFGILPNLASGAITGALNSKYQRDLAAYNAQLNYKYNEMAAEAADKRTRALYGDLMSPASRIKQLKEAGLSPSLYAEGAGAGSQGLSQGAQGSGASGVGLPSPMIAPIDAAQIRLMNAQAQKAEAEAETERGDNSRGEAEVAQLQQNVKLTVENTNNAALKGAYMEYENALKSIELGVEASISDAKIEAYKYELKNLKYRTRSAKVKASIDEQTETNIVKLADLQTKQVIANILKTKAETALAGTEKKLTEKQIEDLTNQITNRDANTKINRDTLTQNIREWAIANGIVTDNNASWWDIFQRNIFSEKTIENLIDLIDALN